MFSKLTVPSGGHNKRAREMRPLLTAASSGSEQAICRTAPPYLMLLRAGLGACASLTVVQVESTGCDCIFLCWPPQSRLIPQI